jgi:squalene synthase HpnC
MLSVTHRVLKVSRFAKPLTPSLSVAYDVCESFARNHYENFPIASWLMPRDMRPHVAAVYAFARIADDMADEGELSQDQRHRSLDAWQIRLSKCVTGTGKIFTNDADIMKHVSPETASQVFYALGHTIRAHKLPLSLFQDLLSAFRQDITTHRYTTWSQLLDYCCRSANPVGRLVLRIAGYRESKLDRASDGFCTALQLTNFLQDFKQDWQRGRLYVPEDDLSECGAVVGHLEVGRFDQAWQCALGRVVNRTRQLFSVGRPLCDDVHGRLRFELRLAWLGGLTILDRLEQGSFDVFKSSPRIQKSDLFSLLWRAVMWK